MPIGLIVHGGAGMHRNKDHAGVLAACRSAVEAGRARLVAGGTAVEAVEAAVRVLEDSPLLNAGYGSVLNSDGVCEMDAMILEGGQGRIGAVGAVRRIRNPISAARLVMERTKHHLLVAEGAERFAAAQGCPMVEPAAMIAPGRHEDDEGGDTVGAVALDLNGGLAVAVSTGGIRGKMPGRVGDSPIPGAGGYADNLLGGACATGLGETIMRSTLTFRAVRLLADYRQAQAAADAVMPIFIRYEGDGGLIVLDTAGRAGFAHNTPWMPVAWIDGATIQAVMKRP